MGHCCNKEGDRRWMWRPYNDRHITRAQILSIISIIPAALHVVTLCLSVFGMLWLLLLSCLRHNRTALWHLVLVSVITAVALICEGLIAPKDFDIYPKVIGWGSCGDRCQYNVVMISTLACGFLWIYIAYCIVRFLKSGGYERCEGEIRENSGRIAEEGDNEVNEEEGTTSNSQNV